MLDTAEKFYNMGYNYIAGIDEVGRGPLAGPVCAAAVILPRGFAIDEINDSKKISEKKREKLYDVIIDAAVAYSVFCRTRGNRRDKYSPRNTPRDAGGGERPAAGGGLFAR